MPEKKIEVFHEVRCPGENPEQECGRFLGDISADHDHSEHYRCPVCSILWRITVQQGFLPNFKKIGKDYPKAYIGAQLRTVEYAG